MSPPKPPPDNAADAPRDDAPGGTSDRPPAPRRDRLRGIARRLFRELEDDLDEDGNDTRPAGDRPVPRGDARELFATVLETGDKAKTEIVRMVAREVRSYLEALDLHKDIHHLLTNYSLEVKASVHLKPLADAMGPPVAEPPADDANAPQLPERLGETAD